jgi:hypothetical protein
MQFTIFWFFYFSVLLFAFRSCRWIEIIILHTISSFINCWMNYWNSLISPLNFLKILSIFVHVHVHVSMSMSMSMSMPMFRLILMLMLMLMLMLFLMLMSFLMFIFTYQRLIANCEKSRMNFIFHNSMISVLMTNYRKGYYKLHFVWWIICSMLRNNQFCENQRLVQFFFSDKIIRIIERDHNFCNLQFQSCTFLMSINSPSANMDINSQSDS